MAAESVAQGQAVRETVQGPTSTWAAASLLCSIALCCPAMPVVAVLLALRAIVELRANPILRGWGLAKSGLVIGLLGTLLWIGGAMWWHFNARRPMMHGPREELRAGFAGDLTVFMAGFTSEGSSSRVSEAPQFLAEAARRYGRFIDSAQSKTPSAKAAMTGPAELPVSYTLQFERQSVEAEAVFVTFGQTRLVPQPVFKWKWIRIIDSQQGDLVYPVSAQSQAP